MSAIAEAHMPVSNIRPPSRIRRDTSRSSSKLKWNNVTCDTAPV